MQILFTALHHSREAMSLSMVIKIMLEQLHYLFNNRKSQSVKIPAKSNLITQTEGEFKTTEAPNQYPRFMADEIEQEPSSKFDLFDFVDILFIPIVNLDGYSYISQNFGRKNWEQAKFKRKNFNATQPC